MAEYVTRDWHGSEGFSRRDRRSGHYDVYLPDPITHRQVSLSSATSVLLTAAEAALHALSEAPGADRLGQIAPQLTRSEAAASSWIEGVTPSARQVAFAELAQLEDVRGFSGQAKLVANAMTALRVATSKLVSAPVIEVTDIVALQAALLPDQPRLHGLRTDQNWIGGSPWHPLDAAYVPPPADVVPGLMEDLARAASGTGWTPLVQAALVHAQFETLHAFADGNGRIGRALIHTVLARRGMATAALVPVSLVLMTRQQAYIDGLNAFRHVGGRDSPEAQKALDDWLQVFLRAFIDATIETQRIARDVADLTDEWVDMLRALRRSRGQREQPRRDSVVARILEGLVGSPVMTITTARRLYGVSATAASAALTELSDAGVLAVKWDRAQSVYFTPSLVDMLNLSERRLASPDFDTRRSGPVRGVPALPAATVPEPGGVEWSAAATSVWGKTNRDDGSWMRLVQHLEDSSAVAASLWDEWLAPNVRRAISSGLPGGESDGRMLFTWLAGSHDVGKASPGFAVKALMTPGFGGLLTTMDQFGLVCPTYVPGSSQKLPPHCRIGQFVLNRWLKERHGISGSAANAFSVVVGGHHGVQPTNMELEALRGDRWTGAADEAWAAVQAEILDRMAELTGVSARLEQWRGVRLERPAQALLSAAVVVADWLASDERRFPYGDSRSSADRVARARLGKSLRGPWHPAAVAPANEEALSVRFPVLSGRPMSASQQAMLEEARAMTEPGLLVLEAPMGSGKTEAALLAAEELARKFGCGGVFVGLPTMATSDAMFDRVLEWTRHLESEDAATVFLAHGRARLNENYQGLVTDSWVRGVNSTEHPDDAAETAVVTSWLQGRRKGILANFVVGTIDQALFGALQTRHVALRHLALAGKVVIIDEVHAADSYMRRYLTRALEWLGSYGTPVILLSATLPPAQRQELVSAYGRGRGVVPGDVDTGDDYPVITVQGASTHHRAVPPVKADDRLVELHSLNDVDLRAQVESLVDAGACVLVVRNTVQKAQQTFDLLSQGVGPDRIMLLHSRFVAVDRLHLESRLMDLYGPPHREGVKRPQGFVVVGTQVVEQSLDIDADVLFTDHAPTDLLLQRIGRLHRHRRGEGERERPEAVRAARTYVIGMPSADDAPELDRGSAAVYGASLLLRSAAVLHARCGGEPLQLPREIPNLVRVTYADEVSHPPSWASAWAEAEAKAITLEAGRRQRADAFRLSEPRPGNNRTLVGLVEVRTSEDPDSTGGRAQVRDSEDGLEVILVQQVSGEYRVLDGAHPFSGHSLGVVSMSPPEPELALALASYTVGLPRSFTHSPKRFDQVLDELERHGRDFMGWQQSPYLSGQLVLSLDQQGHATVAGTRLSYDVTRGLRVMQDA